ncbi:MAG: aminotransferase class IV [Candidatus Nanopelagicales bacterium]|jgi:branched-chain amino acid aminotransferase
MMIWLGDREIGSIVPADEALVSVLDHGFTVADGVFETLKVAHGRPFALTRHLERLARSAAALGLQAPDEGVVRDAVGEVIFANAPVIGSLGRLRITYTAGEAPLGSDRGHALPTLVVAMARSSAWPEATTCSTVPWVRNERSPIVGVKSTSYAENVVALRYAHDRGASEAVLANTRDELCEGTGTNVFVVIEGRLLTPPIFSGCLAGITRQLVIDWFGAVEESLPYDALLTADEVFLTSSTRDVHPVIRIDERTWAEPGLNSSRLREEFIAKSAVDDDP